MKSQFVFIILHYCVPEITIKCIESICSTLSCNNYKIVVVDNASPDGSGSLLQKKYSEYENIHFILNEQNEGFARGNNAGYRYARETLNPDFIVMLNNDCQMIQQDFLEKMLEIYRQTSFHILGPDILTPTGEHRNPHRMKTFSRKDVERIIRNRTVILFYLKAKRLLHMEKIVMFIENWDQRRSVSERAEVIHDCPLKDVVLQGSCLIFSKDYLLKEEEAFCPETFMWLEEEILSYTCMRKGYSIRYNPQIRILHLEEASTKSDKDPYEKYLFFTEQLRRSAIVFRRIMMQYESGG